MKLSTLTHVSGLALAVSARVAFQPRNELDIGNSTNNATSIPEDTTASTLDQEEFTATDPFPVWNLNNVSCQGLDDMASHDLWGLVRGDETILQFQTMLAENQLYCKECPGSTEGSCTSSNNECSQGLHDRAGGRWDVAVGALNNIKSLWCRIGEGNCGEDKTCAAAYGPGAWVMAQSLATLDNLYNNIYNAIGAAGLSANGKMTRFQEVFAPVPKPQDNSFVLGLFGAITSGLVGFIPGAGAAVGGLIAGVGNAVLAEINKQDDPEPIEIASAMTRMTNAIQKSYQDITDSLFSTGRYSYTGPNGDEVNLTLADLMKNGSVLAAEPALAAFTNEKSKYETILFQQLAVFTWRNMLTGNGGDDGHLPFIGFDPMPCSQVDANKETAAAYTTFRDTNALGSSYEIDDICYYLLDGTTDDANGLFCGAKALPGGTIQSFEEHRETFNLTIEDFIEPSVRGWLDHGKSNTWTVASESHALVENIRSPGAVKIPVCDYKGKPSSPGVGCPRWGANVDNLNICETYAGDSEENPGGASNPGWCQLHVDQFQRREGNLNPTDFYQLEISVFDALERKVGFATKQPATAPLEVQGSLPYNLIVAAGNSDEEPLSFWYSDQFWTSDSKEANLCDVGVYDGGMRKMDCGFQCPAMSNNPPVSATEGNRLPAAPTKAVAGPSSFINTFTSAEPTGAPAPAPTPTYAKGWCTFHMTQWQKNDVRRNPNPDYAIEMSIYDSNKNLIGASGKILTPDGQATLVRGGLEHYLIITPGGVDADPFTMGYAGASWRTDGGQCSPYDEQVYEDGKRELDCGFTC